MRKFKDHILQITQTKDIDYYDSLSEEERKTFYLRSEEKVTPEVGGVKGFFANREGLVAQSFRRFHRWGK
jgi:hypothetical protein